ncbi:MAG TPA: hypothetical protein VFL17_09165 [Anaerolineae bacterium]|nr:hypothetical protein [Anaerolineae bacterium]
MLTELVSQLQMQSVLTAGAALSGVQQQASDDVVRTVTSILLISACLLPILMAVFGAVVMRFLGWFTGPREAQADEVVYAEPALPSGVHLPASTIWPAVLAFGLMGLLFAIPLEGWLEAIAALVGLVLTAVGLIGWIVLAVREARAHGS